ncbi:MAG TPA: MBL fold metallo-hydrolase [Cyclobacteriaceae bacterium]|nr:MBL fold metallo-hydrolase [Cyclobacteriaceae bacterium]
MKFHINILFVAFLGIACAANAQPKKVQSLKVTILSTMLADQGIGEWGFAALVEFDGRKMLFDTGARPETVLSNAAELDIDLSGVTDVFISHGHADHTGGLMTLRKNFSARNPKALSVAHIGDGAFYPRPDNPEFTHFLTKLKTDYEVSGGRFQTYKSAEEIYPGVWITGPVPRVNDERNWSGNGKVARSNGQVTEDNVPEDQSLVFNTNEGLVIISGCGHAGVINTMEYARKLAGPQPVTTLIGGFHLFNLSDEKMSWTIDKMKAYRVNTVFGAHCTGINAMFAIQKNMSLDRHHAVVAAVGASYELGKGISPGEVAK